MSVPKKLSIITVCRNIRDSIGKTCDSIVRQTWTDFEWIVVDGASSDGTLEVVGEYRDRITLLISEKDSGIYNAMNKGIRAATGEWVIFLNGGDQLAADTVLEQVFGGGERDADILHGNILTEIGGELVGNGDTWVPETITPSYFVRGSLNHQSAFIRRSLFDRFGLYDEGIPIAADYEKWIVFAKNGCRFEKVHLFVAIYNMEGGSSVKEFRHIVRRSKALVHKRHFTRREIAEGDREWKKRARYVVAREFLPLFGYTSLFSVRTSPDGLRTKYCLFGMQLFKLRKAGKSKNKSYLLGFIPV